MMVKITGKFFNRTRTRLLSSLGILITVVDMIALYLIYQNQIHNRVDSNPYIIPIIVGIIGLAILLTGIINYQSNIEIAFIFEKDNMKIIIDEDGSNKTVLDSINDYDVFISDETIPTVNLKVRSGNKEIVFSEHLPYGYTPEERFTKISNQYWINYLSKESGALLEFIGYLKKK